MDIKYSLVVPAYNEEAVLDESYKRLKDIMEQLKAEYEMIFVNDGSKDNTLNILKELAKKDPHVKVLSFSKNFGHQLAVTAGLEHTSGDAVIIIDADLQDPPSVILDMVKLWEEGHDVVYGQRLKRKGETAFKKLTAHVFYRTLRYMSGQDIPVDTGDFRLIDRKVRDAMCAMPEHNRFLRGMVSWVGFNQVPCKYVRDERFAGETKYTLKKMLKLAGDGITGFSDKPMKIPMAFGAGLGFLSCVYLLVLIIMAICGAAPNFSVWALAIMLLVSSIILVSMGILGLYIGRIYVEAQGRPLYLLQEKIGFDK